MCVYLITSLNGGEGYSVNDVLLVGASGQVVNRFAQPLQHRTNANHAGTALNGFIRGITRVEIGKDKHRCITRNRTVGCLDRKSTRLNSSHVAISYAVFCLKKKNRGTRSTRSSTRKAGRGSTGTSR